MWLFTMKPAIFSFGSIVLFSLLCCLGCSKKIEIDQRHVVGTYRGTIEGRTETLELRPEGTYVLQRDLGDHEQVIATGDWELTPYDDEMRIAAHGFPDRRNKADQGSSSSITLLGVEG